jgi:hypothetical protein
MWCRRRLTGPRCAVARLPLRRGCGELTASRRIGVMPPSGNHGADRTSLASADGTRRKPPFTIMAGAGHGSLEQAAPPMSVASHVGPWVTAKRSAPADRPAPTTRLHPAAQRSWRSWGNASRAGWRACGGEYNRDLASPERPSRHGSPRFPVLSMCGLMLSGKAHVVTRALTGGSMKTLRVQRPSPALAVAVVALGGASSAASRSSRAAGRRV